MSDSCSYAEAPVELQIDAESLASVQRAVRDALGIPARSPVVVPIEFFDPVGGQWQTLLDPKMLPNRDKIPVKLRCGTFYATHRDQPWRILPCWRLSICASPPSLLRAREKSSSYLQLTVLACSRYHDENQQG